MENIYKIVDGHRIKLGLDLVNSGEDTADIDAIMYRLCATADGRELLTEPVSILEIDDMYNITGDFILEDLVITKFSEAEKRLGIIVKLFNKKLKDKNEALKADGQPEIIAQSPVIGRPRKTGMIAVVTAEIPFSDGQSIFIVFHSPDNEETRITGQDEIIAFRWMLNKRDITHVISPEQGKDIPVRQLADRIAKIVSKNSVAFTKRQTAVKEQKGKLEDINSQLVFLEKEKGELAGQLADSEKTIEEKRDGVLTAKKKEYENMVAEVEDLEMEVADLQIKIDEIEARKKAEPEPNPEKIRRESTLEEKIAAAEKLGEEAFRAGMKRDSDNDPGMDDMATKFPIHEWPKMLKAWETGFDKAASGASKPTPIKATKNKKPVKKNKPGKKAESSETKLQKLATAVLDGEHDHLPLDELLDLLTPVFEDLDPAENEDLFEKLDKYTTEKTLEAAKAA